MTWSAWRTRNMLAWQRLRDEMTTRHQLDRVDALARQHAAHAKAERSVMRCHGAMRTSWPIVEPKVEPICTIGPSRPTEPPVPMQIAEASDFTAATTGRILLSL